MTNFKQILKEFEDKFDPTPCAATGINLIMQQIIEKHNSEIKEFLLYAMKESSKSVIPEEGETRMDVDEVEGFNQCRQEMIDNTNKFFK